LKFNRKGIHVRRSGSNVRFGLCCLAALAAAAECSAPLQAQTAACPTPAAHSPDETAAASAADDASPANNSLAAKAPIAEYRSKHFLVRTDLAKDRADALVERLEATLRIVEKYWGRPSRGRIECYVVDDLANWSDDALPHPLARVLVGGVGGATVVRSQREGKRIKHKPEVYASARPGVAEHESVHAYCTSAFGATGPDWYREGMADRAYYHRHGERDVQLPPDTMASLKQGKRRTLHEIVNRGRITGELSQSVDKLLAEHEADRQIQGLSGEAKNVPLEAWRPEHEQDVKTARESYLWSWALCHLLCENPNYAPRFRALGLGYLTGQSAKFEQAFDAVSREMSFEYDLFLQHVEQGYRVDLCVWDWNKSFLSAAERTAIVASVSAARGYQPSGLKVRAGERIAYAASGAWTLDAEGDALSADGAAGGRGRLVGALFDEFKLSEPFELGARGAFTAPAAGKLYLRCRDDWGSLADNRGVVSVRFSTPEERQESSDR